MFPEGVLGLHRMNSSNLTTGGYVGSEMWTTTIPKYVTGIDNAFKISGVSHILSHKELLSTSINANTASGAYSGYTGAASDFEWQTVKVNLFNENMVYGGRCLSSSFFDIGDCSTQVAAMRHNKSLSCTRSGWCWLRSVVDSTSFAGANRDGRARYSGASYTGSRVRPYFLLT
jgi:hypothetical protein